MRLRGLDHPQTKDLYTYIIRSSQSYRVEYTYKF